MWPENLWLYIQHESYDVFEWAKCGTSALSAAPTLLWAAGAAALVHRLLAALFRRFLFRRVPWWELLLQHLLFVWMVIYSVHFWVVLVRVVKVLVDYMYDETLNSLVMFEDPPEAASRYILQQWALWVCAAVPLAVYIHTRPRPEPPPLMIWITTSPWQRREMGPYGYYLQRPPARAAPPPPRA
ncbi:uncharacterized protein, partial [Choristoneura fumiferana]|uniref:uncharacterized protein n=1 Tax=Choristoneura fumiferana TaxID=7141 RepID=UPI003D15C90F